MNFIDNGKIEAKLTIERGETTFDILTSELTQGSFCIDKYSSTAVAMELGNVTAAQLTFSVDTTIFEGTLQKGDKVTGALWASEDPDEKLPIGEFYIISLKKGYNTISVTCLDKMITLDAKADVTHTSFPSTAGVVVNSLFSEQLGYTVVYDTAVYQDAPVKLPSLVEGTTYRQLLASLCELMGANAYFGTDGNLHIAWYAKQPTETVDSSKRVASEITTHTFRVTKIDISTDAGASSVTVDGNEITLCIINNPFLTGATPDEIARIKTGILDVVGGIDYYGGSAATLPMPYLQPMDAVDFGDNQIVPITHVTFGINTNTQISGDLGTDDNEYNYGVSKAIEQTQLAVIEYADGIEDKAREYTNTKATETETTVKDYTDTKTAETETAVKAYTDTKAIETEENAKSYADTVEQEAKEYAEQMAAQAVLDMTQEDVFNKLTQNGEKQGLMLDGQTGDVYVNASYINTGTLSAILIRDKSGKNYWNLETGDFRLGEDSDGDVQGIVRKDGKLYINGEYIQSETLKGNKLYGGVIRGLNGNLVIDLDNDQIYWDGLATQEDIEDLQSQIDSAQSTWSGDGVPTLSNEPASEWKTNEEKNRHIGDVYYDAETGYAYRFINSNGTYSWKKISDSDAAKALEQSEQALNIVSNDFDFQTPHTWNSAHTVATFTAHVYRGISEVTNEFPPTFFKWYLRNEDNITETEIGTGRTCVVDTSVLGYGSTIIGEFSVYDSAYLTLKDGTRLTLKDGTLLTVYLRN